MTANAAGRRPRARADHVQARDPDEVIASLAHRYRASREVVIRRLLILGRTTEAFYRKKRKGLQAEITSNDLSSFLEVRLKHIPKIERAVLQRAMAAGAPA